MKKVAILLSLIVSVNAQIGDVTTFAGSGTAGAVDGIGTAASLNYPPSLVTTADGTLYVSDYGNNLIRKISTEGVVTTFAGTGNAESIDGVGLSAAFNQPAFLIIDGNNNLFLSEWEGHKIRKITPDGTVTTFAGSGNAGVADGVGTAAKFYKPAGMAFDNDGNLYVSDAGNNRIRKISPEGVVSTFYVNAEELGSPRGITFDKDGNLFVANTFKHVISKIDQNGTLTTFAGTGEEGYLDGEKSTAMFNGPVTIKILDNGDMLISDRYNHVIRKISNGIVTTFAGKGGVSGFVNGIGVRARFNNPYGMVFGQNNEIYLADFSNHSIRKIKEVVYTPQVLKVPSVYSTIQAAIDEANKSDTVLVADGTYTENLSIDKDIKIISENGAEKTIIDGGKITHVIGFGSSTTRDCVLDGFTVTNGGGDDAGGILVSGGFPILRNLIITGNRNEKYSGGGIDVVGEGANPVIEDCIITDNYATDSGGGLMVAQKATATINDVTISNNTAGGNGGGINVWEGSIKIKNAILENNSAKYQMAMSVGTGDTLDFRPIIDIENVEVINQRDSTINELVSFSECSLTVKNLSFSNIRTESNVGSFWASYLNIENLFLKDIRDNGHSLLFSGSKGTVSGLTIERDTSRWAIAKIEKGSKIDFNNLKMSNSKTSDFSGLFIDDATVTIDTLDINNCNWESHSIRVNKSIFTLSNGNFSSIVSEDGNAGIDASESSSVEISNTTIDSSSSGGHAMNFNGVKKVSITNSLFNGNHSQFSGGVIFAREIDSLLIENSSFVADTSGGEGGAIQLSSKNKFVRILKSTFSNNLSNSAGAINSWNTDSLFIDNSTFDGNVSSSSGAVSINADGTISAYFEIKNSDFIDNKAGTLGGALWIGNSEGYIQNVGIFNNESVDNFGGGIYISENVELTMNAVTISGNSSPEPAGEGIAIDGGNIIIKNSIIWDNHIQKNSGSIDITYSNIEGGFTGTGNIDANPIFCDTINYLIRDTSPCVGTGENGSNMGARGIGCYRPTSFDWVSTALDTINITQSNLADTYTLQWSASTDVDGDSINYLLYAQIGVYPAEEISDTTSLSVPITYQEILEGVFEGRPVNGATVRFNVKATDGIDTVDVTGDNRVIYVNRYEYLSTEGEGVPVEFALHENYPNPFNPTTTLRFDLPEVSDITLTIYNMLGQKVRTFDYQNTSAGYHSVKWNATNDYGDPVGAGVYLYQLQTKDFVKTRKMVLLK